jgi:pyrimidine operon attenuation protein / uracil phosphoribosyltransferase
MSPDRVRRTLSRFAYQIVERNRGSSRAVIFGIVSRGVTLAEMVADLIAEIEGERPRVYALDVTPFRDDLPSPPQVEPIDPVPQVEGRDIILVDDVLFTGRTVRAAMDAILYYGRPASIQLAVLIDRGHREYPIQPDYLGQQIPTKHQERVIVEVTDRPRVYLEDA